MQLIHFYTSNLYFKKVAMKEHNEELHNLHSSPNITMLIYLRRMRLGSIWHMEKMRCTQQNILIGKYDG